LLMF